VSGVGARLVRLPEGPGRLRGRRVEVRGRGIAPRGCSAAVARPEPEAIEPVVGARPGSGGVRVEFSSATGAGGG